MEIFKTFKEKLVRGAICLKPVPDAVMQMSILANIVIERETMSLLVKIVLEDGTDFMFQRVDVPQPGDTITLKDVQIITDITIT